MNHTTTLAIDLETKLIIGSLALDSNYDLAALAAALAAVDAAAAAGRLRWASPSPPTTGP